jgi:NADH-quinone oxidoreductase subunit N
MFNVLFNVLFYFQFILSFSAIGSMLVGALMAIKQVRIKRFVAYTSINQMGFIMLGLASCNLTGLIATLFYISLYSVMSLIFFTIFLNSENIVTRRSMVFLSDLYSFSIFNNKHSKHLVLAIFSMAGLPPLGGFIGKLLIYFSVIEAKLDLLLMLSLLISMVSAFYYLSFVRYIFFEKQSNSKLYYYIKKNSFDNLLFLLSSFLLFFIVILPPLFPIISSIALSCSWPLVWY